MTPRYGMIIQWSDEDDAFVVSFPDFPSAHTHGASYAEAAQNGEQALELLAKNLKSKNMKLPPSRQLIMAVG
jgi:predicted RNase H-like HicB family nuclease